MLKTLAYGLLYALILPCASAATTCPSGMGEVPGYPPYSNQAYCMMLDEAILHNVAGAHAWEYVSQAHAQQQCEAAFTQGDIPVNALWQALILQAEQVPENWSGGTVGEGQLATDLKLPKGDGAFTVFKRIGAGHWEFVQGAGPVGSEIIAGYSYELAGGDTRTFSINGLTGNARFHFGPYDTYGPDAQLGVTTNRASSDIMRGGDDSEPGAFGVALNNSGNAASDVSFRCVCPKYACGIP